jgi:hypothetical protein
MADDPWYMGPGLLLAFGLTLLVLAVWYLSSRPRP